MTHAIFDAWHDICGSDDIVAGTGMAARVLGRQLAIFSTNEGYFALGNGDPFSGANVLARGIIGDISGKLVVASPVYKQHFCLRTGICLEDMSVSVPVWRVSVRDGRICVSEGER
ncbi:nitrite reductase (NADH) small subunit [Paraperlucidibaca baekdonensis]|uniref:Nitrite reductase (NADH) small subunit n=1 Tax=Paraperlucidibaca baekdonensis TaxID=748120 RepID=A0A3E0H824_9GAMM|nr:nitrite reductase small subunit NirD [Paraperlucidibaca baekdonensis]REH38986.1 nitrite reductase (NADH) small subunit [Paraperlucidibaca baekdonensis]